MNVDGIRLIPFQEVGLGLYAAVVRKAQELVRYNKPIVYPTFGELVPEEILHRSGYWQFDVLATLENHHKWIRHKNRDRRSWGNCGFPSTEKPQTHFHPPV